MLKNYLIGISIFVAAVVAIVIYKAKKAADRKAAAELKKAADELAEKEARELATFDKENINTNTDIDLRIDDVIDPKGDTYSKADIIRDGITYDPESDIGKGIIEFKINEINNTPSQIYAIKKAWGIGQTVFDGLNKSDYNSGGINRPIRNDIQRFFFEKMSRNMNWSDNGTFGIYTDIQKPMLRGEIQKIIKLDAKSQTDYSSRGIGWARFATFMNANPLSDEFMGNSDRALELTVLTELQQFARNYIKEMDRLEQLVYNAAIRVLAANGQYFSGITA